MRKWFAVLVLVIIIALVLAGCWKSEWPKKVTPNGEMGVTITAYRYDSAWVSFPESEYTVESTFYLGGDFTQLEDSDWWDRVHTVLEKHYYTEREELEPYQYFIHKIPSVEWLKENIHHRGVSVYRMVKFNLPSGGRLQRKVERESYDQYIKKYGRDEENFLDPVHLVFEDGQELYSMGAVLEYGTEGTYIKDLDTVQEAVGGILVFESPDKDYYAILHLPEELQGMGKEGLKLGQPYEATITAVTYREKS